MKPLQRNLTILANAFKIEFLNFYQGISHGEFVTCMPHARLVYMVNCTKPARLDDGHKIIEFKRGMWLLIPPKVRVRHFHDNIQHVSLHFNCMPGFMELLNVFDSIQCGQDDELMTWAGAMRQDDPLNFVNRAELLVRSVLNKLLDTPEMQHAQSLEKILIYQDLTDYLQQKSDLQIKVSDMARFMRMGEQTFARKFTADMHITPRKYNEKIIINQAMQLLSSSDLTLKEIAVKLHIADEYCFSRFFKRHTGLPPGAFRRAIIESQHN